ncbi:hypothetical protein AB0D13_19410 [Streptomyces sp. NPDC048430]|uniref:hypothetical protein n=1 Tax=unclassified Streptomyces TaxID=2593676 RepID=UPI00341457BE
MIPLSSLASRLAPRTLRGRLSLVALTTASLLMVILTIVFNTVVGAKVVFLARGLFGVPPGEWS